MKTWSNIYAFKNPFEIGYIKLKAKTIEGKRLKTDLNIPNSQIGVSQKKIDSNKIELNKGNVLQTNLFNNNYHH